MDSRKLELRQLYKELRRSNSAQFSWEKLLSHPLFTEAKTVASFISFGDEPDTTVLNSQILEAGKVLLLPVLQPDLDLEWRQWSGDPHMLSRKGNLLEPVGTSYRRDIDLVIVPALAVDTHGTRLGRGGGSYDRALQKLSAPKIALVFDNEFTENDLPRELHDRPVDAVLTPTKLFFF